MDTALKKKSKVLGYIGVDCFIGVGQYTMQLEAIDPSSKGFQIGFATSKLNHTVLLVYMDRLLTYLFPWESHLFRPQGQFMGDSQSWEGWKRNEWCHCSPGWGFKF